jgi:hypothetical protein
MKNYIYVFGITIMLILSLVGCSDKSNSPVAPADESSLGKVTIREFTGTDYPTGLIDPGTTTVHKEKMKIRGMRQSFAFQVLFSDGGIDLLSGEGDLELNANIDLTNGTAFWWGKKLLTPSAPEALGGQFKFTWHGSAVLGPSGWTLSVKEVGHGEGGALTGIQCFFDNIITAPPDLSTWSGDLEGYLRTH